MRIAELYEIEGRTLQTYVADETGRIPDEVVQMLLHRMQIQAVECIIDDRRAKDPSIELRFDDDSVAIVSNPAQERFPIHVAEAFE